MSILSLSNVRSEGGLLPVDVLQRIVSRDRELPGMYPKLTQGDPSDSLEREKNPWNLSGGERLTDAINRSWQKMLAVWRRFAELRNNLPEGDPGTRLTREELLLPLFAELGYGRLVAARPEDRLVRGSGAVSGSQEKSYPVSHFWLHSPIHLVGCGVDMDRRTRGIAGAAQNSPHSLVQEFLNRSDAHLWGFVSNGLVLRILRDNASLSRQAFVEFDLQGLFNGESFADFALLWMLCHQSRVEAEKPENCWLEQWMREGRDAAVLALDSLRGAVRRAIVALGQGFMDSRNPALRQRLYNGSLTRREYFRQLLRLVYRIIFLFVLAITYFTTKWIGRCCMARRPRQSAGIATSVPIPCLDCGNLPQAYRATDTATCMKASSWLWTGLSAWAVLNWALPLWAVFCGRTRPCRILRHAACAMPTCSGL